MSDRYTTFFLNSGSHVARLDLIEISHPSFSKIYRIVRNAINGITVRHENGVEYAYEYVPLKITPTASKDDLDQVINIDFGDLGTALPKELDAVNAAGTFETKPVLMYREYRSDDLTYPMYGPVKYEINVVPFKKEGAAFQASAPRLNQNATGEIYSTDRFPMLRGFI